MCNSDESSTKQQGEEFQNVVKFLQNSLLYFIFGGIFELKYVWFLSHVSKKNEGI